MRINKEYHELIRKIKEHNRKMGKKHEQIPTKRKHKWPQIYGTLYYLIHNKGNAIKYHGKISFLANQVGQNFKAWQYQVFLGMYDKNSHILLMISATTLKTTWVSLLKLTILSPLAQEFHSQVHYCFCPSEDTYNQGHSSIVLISKIWKHPKCTLTFK